LRIVRKAVAYITRNGRVLFFELPLLVDAPATWDRMVEEGNGLFTFSFFWVDSTTVPKEVYPGHDVFLRHVLPQI